MGNLRSKTAEEINQMAGLTLAEKNAEITLENQRLNCEINEIDQRSISMRDDIAHLNKELKRLAGANWKIKCENSENISKKEELETIVLKFHSQLEGRLAIIEYLEAKIFTN